MKTVIIFHADYVAHPNTKAGGWIASSSDFRELVHLAALKIDAQTLQILGGFDAYVKPLNELVLTKNFTSLTGITSQILQEKGHTFSEVYDAFVRFVGNSPCYSHSQSLEGAFPILGDAVILRENLVAYGRSKEFPKIEYHNLFSWFVKNYQKYGYIYRQDVNSRNIATFLGLSVPEGATQVPSLADEYSILAGLQFFHLKGEDFPF